MTEKKARKQEDDLKARHDRQQKLMQEHKEKMMPLVRFLKREGLDFHSAQVGQSRIEFFRLDQLEALQQDRQDKISKSPQMSKLLQQLDLIYLKRPDNSKNLKYPHVLEPAPSTDPNAKFATFRFDTAYSRKWLIISVLLGVLALVLFPVWPFALKYAVWLVSLYLLVLIVGLLLFRLLVYVVCVVLGFNVWILPNLLGDYGFLDSFKPFIYYQRWEASKLNVAIRVGALLLLVCYGAKLYIDPEFAQGHFSFTKSTIDDIHDWGVAKIKNEVKFSERAITNLEDILNQTADVQENLAQDVGGGQVPEDGQNQVNSGKSQDAEL